MSAAGEQQKQVLIWSQPKALKRRFELRSGDAIIGTMHWEKGAGIAEMPGGVWHFKRKGVFKQHIPVYEIDEVGKKEVGTFYYTRPAQGMLTLLDGRQFDWKRPKKLKSRWQVVDVESRVIFECQLRSGFKGTGAEITIHHPPDDPRLFDLLVVLGFYLTAMYAYDAAAAAS